MSVPLFQGIKKNFAVFLSAPDKSDFTRMALVSGAARFPS